MASDAAAHARLAAARASTQARLRELEADVAQIVAATDGANADDEHDPEGATIAFERAQTSALADAALRQLRELDASEGRLRDGTYGVCEVCGSVIPEERLDALPTTRTCVDHAPRLR